MHIAVNSVLFQERCKAVQTRNHQHKYPIDWNKELYFYTAKRARILYDMQEK